MRYVLFFCVAMLVSFVLYFATRPVDQAYAHRQKVLREKAERTKSGIEIIHLPPVTCYVVSNGYGNSGISCVK
jgi:hypothetical protein